MVHDRRPQILVLDRQHLGQGLGFGFQPLHAAFGFRQRTARGFQRLARRGMRGFGLDGRFFGVGDRLLKFIDSGLQRRQIGTIGRLQSADFAGDLRHLGLELGGAIAVLAHGIGQLIALRGQVGEALGQF